MKAIFAGEGVYGGAGVMLVGVMLEGEEGEKVETGRRRCEGLVYSRAC
jgi:hypothetical protein